MKRREQLLEERNQKLYNRFVQLCKIKVGKIQLYNYAAILEMLSREFFLEPLTIERIVKKKVRKG